MIKITGYCLNIISGGCHFFNGHVLVIVTNSETGLNGEEPKPVGTGFASQYQFRVSFEKPVFTYW